MRSVSLAAVLINFLRRWLENLKYRPPGDARSIAFLMIRLHCSIKLSGNFLVGGEKTHGEVLVNKQNSVDKEKAV